jgi:Flp pilus assembly protein TadG
MALVACKRSQKRANRERGQALLEMVPVAALLLTLTFGVIETGYAIWQLEVITALSREGSNLASRNTPLPTSAQTVINDGVVLKNANNGQMKVIVTAVQNQNGAFIVTGQASSGSLSATSRVGTALNKSATLPAGSTIPLNGSVYVTEVFSQYTAITPLGGFVKVTMPATLYDAAYF